MKNNIRYYLNRALVMAQCSDDRKHFQLAAIGIRADGTTVASTNIRTPIRCRSAHAETRLSRKLDVGSVVYVARASKLGEWAMARPCENCQKTLRTRGVKRVYYTVGPSEFGCIILRN